mmetsp:Transcript_19481/g.41086  ORF Transcript_19481/g.41086 Transcript_19481/m.41086 type:complete len:360 (+) Transcript_19481:120-1199(+)
MNSTPFRSHLMQQFAANARTQSRPPLALFSFVGGKGEREEPAATAGFRRLSNSANDSNSTRQRNHRRRPLPLASSISSGTGVSTAGGLSITQTRPSSSESGAKSSGEDDGSSSNSSSDIVQHHLSPTAQTFQHWIASRRTISNFISNSPSQQLSDRQFLHDAIARGVECAIAAPNHKITEPTTFHRIVSPSAASERLLDIAYAATLQRLLDNRLSGEGACRSEAQRKRDKWAKIPAFVVATVSGMDEQTPSTGATTCNDTDSYKELPYVPPTTVRQLEDYASACASIQNLLLSLHAEGLGSKWATGPVIRTRAFRELVRCREDDMVVGLIMVGWPKRLPRMRRRRELDGDVLRDVDFDT